LPNNVARKAKAEKWRTRQRTGRGGGKEYFYNSLPKLTQSVLIQESSHKKVVDLDIDPAKIGSTICTTLAQQVKPTSEQRIA
jgi:Mu DNA-binding domain